VRKTRSQRLTLQNFGGGGGGLAHAHTGSQRPHNTNAAVTERIRHILNTRCDNASVIATQNRNRSGRWPKGTSGNPGGRPRGLARATRELVGEDGMALAQLWWDIARDETRRDSDLTCL
jgi:hypothetical protein